MHDFKVGDIVGYKDTISNADLIAHNDHKNEFEIKKIGGTYSSEQIWLWHKHAWTHDKLLWTSSAELFKVKSPAQTVKPSLQPDEFILDIHEDRAPVDTSKVQDRIKDLCALLQVTHIEQDLDKSLLNIIQGICDLQLKLHDSEQAHITINREVKELASNFDKLKQITLKSLR